MRYYSCILININNATIDIHDIAVPCNRKDAIRFCKEKARQTNCFILCIIESKLIEDRKALMKFNINNINLLKNLYK